MRLSNFLMPTQKEKPKGAVIKSHILLVRAGYIKLLASGVYNYLPLGWRSLRKIENIIREEMDRIGGQEVMLSILNPAEVWQETGRWESFGSEMFRLKDRKEHDMCLAPTHEEIITHIARDAIKSYKDLPQIWYQIQWKFRDEPRPRSGVLRVRQFIMKDSYSLDKDEKGLDLSYEKHREAYKRIFKRCGLNTFIVGASSGLMGGSGSEEFMAPSDAGEDLVIKCKSCKYAANVEVAQFETDKYVFEDGNIEEVHTPVKGDVETVANYLNASPRQFIKSLLYIVDSKPVFVIVPGDRMVIEDKMVKVFGDKFRPATDEEIKEITSAPAGYISPYKLDVDVYMDIRLKGAYGLITGANKKDYHIKNVNPERDFNIKEVHDFVGAKTGDKCPLCGGELEELKCIEVGHIFKLGTRYSNSMNAKYSDENGERKVIVMGSYGIGVERIMATAVEQNGDDKGIVMPITIAPFEVLLLNLDTKDKEVTDIAEKIYKELKNRNIEVLFDDRDVSPGFKFKDADLIGIPFRVNVGKKSLDNGGVELVIRGTGEKNIYSPDEIVDILVSKIEEEYAKYRP